MVEPLTILLLAAAGFVAAFFDSIVGGGGVISLPALLAVGLPPHLALGTNKLAATGASFSATIRYTRAGVVRPSIVLALIPLSVVASMLGAATVLHLEARFVKALVIGMMAVMTLYVLFRPHFGHANRFEKLGVSTLAAGALLALAIGFYDGFLGPGTGSLLLFGFVGIFGFDFVHAAGHARVLNFASNAAALLWFVIQGQIVWELGLPMLASMLVGGWVGSHWGLKHGARWIRPLFVTVTLVLMGRLLLSL